MKNFRHVTFLLAMIIALFSSTIGVSAQEGPGAASFSPGIVPASEMSPFLVAKDLDARLANGEHFDFSPDYNSFWYESQDCTGVIDLSYDYYSATKDATYEIRFGYSQNRMGPLTQSSSWDPENVEPLRGICYLSVEIGW